MRKLFDLDLPVVRAVGTLGTLMLLGFWWLLCCIPIFTVGASTAALYRVLFDLRQDKRASTGDFFRAFRENFKKATVLWLLALLGAAVLAAAYYGIALLEVNDASRLFLMIVLVALLILWLFTLVYLFPLTAFFENSVKATIKNALLMSISHLRQTVVCVGMTLLPVAAVLISSYWFVYLGFVWAFVLPGVLFYVKAGQQMEAYRDFLPEESEPE